MKTSTAVLLGSAAALASALTQQCTGTAKEEGGNWYCGAVEHIQYEGVGTPGTYQAVTAMGSDGTCGQEAKHFSGAISPLEEGVSLHFRGPLLLKQFAVYQMSGYQKRELEPPSTHIHARRHWHGHGHGHGHEAMARRHIDSEEKEKRAAKGADGDDWVTVVMNGQTVSWKNDWHPDRSTAAPAPAAAAPTAAAPVAHAADAKATDAVEAVAGSPAAASSSSATSERPTSPSGGSDYTRVAYYSSEQQTCDGVTFLGNHGGDGSGVFDTTWGMSLAYLNAAGTAGSPTPQCLRDVQIGSNVEFSIFSDTKCDGTCGFSRAPDVAYKGFSGSDQVFLFEFQMPLDGQTGFNGDMPSLWMLNAQIPRTGQYSGCSCWATGCGEFDIFEVLDSGNTKCKSTFHTNVPGGSSDYFDRPVNAPIKVATVFDSVSKSVSIKVLEDSVSFGPGLALSAVEGWVKVTPGSPLSSLFQMT